MLKPLGWEQNKISTALNISNKEKKGGNVKNCLDRAIRR